MKNKKCLEIGVFTGRINRKLGQYFNNITVTEHDKGMLCYWPNGCVFDWVNDSYDEKLQLEQPYDIIVSLGHQLSFSQEVEKGIIEMSQLLGSNGVLLFDIWNGNTSPPVSSSFPIQTMCKEELENVLTRAGLSVYFMTYGPRLFRYFPKLMTLQSRLFGARSLALTKGIERLLLGINFMFKDTQSIYCIAVKHS